MPQRLRVRSRVRFARDRYGAKRFSNGLYNLHSSIRNPLTLLPSREEWDNNEVLGSDVEVFTDGSKMDCGTGSGVFVESLNIEESYKLDDDNSVFQAEVVAISKAAELLMEKSIHNKRITFQANTI